MPFLRPALLTLLLALAFAATLLPSALPAQVPLPSPDAGGAAAAEPTPEEPSVAEALRLLAIVLDDPEARGALVEQLRAAEAAAPAPPAEGAPAPVAPEDLTIPQLIAEQTLGVVEDVSDGVVEILRNLVDVREFVANAREFDFTGVSGVLIGVIAMIVLTLTAYWVLRGAARPLLGRLDASAAEAGFATRPLHKIGAALVESSTVAIAWAIGLGFGVFTQDDNQLHLAQGLYLSAFLYTELARVGIRVLFRPRYASLRLFEIDEKPARHWNFWLSRIVGVLGYGLLFVVPLVEPQATRAFTEWLRLLVVVIALVMAVALILRNRRRVRRAMLVHVEAQPTDVVATAIGALARVWHFLAIGYVIALFVVWRVHPGDAEAFILRATGLSVLALFAGALLIAVISRQVSDGITVSEKMRRELPLLEDRLNNFVPAALLVLRVVIAVLVLATVLTVWGIVDFPGWLASDIGQSIASSFAWIAGALLAAGIVWIVVSSWVEYRLNPNVGRRPTARERTLLSLFSNAFVVVLIVMTVMSVLNTLGINIAPLIAGAGVVGLAIGFGAQKLVQDIINGAFIQFENTMNEGDVVTAGGTTGVVEKLTIRSVSLRDVNGNYHMIPFSGVDNVTNFTKTFSHHVADIGVAYRENIAEVKEAMQEAFDRLMETEHRAHILPPFEMFGINEFADSAIIVRGRIKTLPGQQWAVGRAYNEAIKEVFDARGIEIPFPHRTIYIGEDKAGRSPPLTIRSERVPQAGTPAAPDAPARPEAAPAGSGPDGRPRGGITPPDRELTPPAAEDVT